MLSWRRSMLQTLIPSLTLFVYLNFSTTALLFLCRIPSVLMCRFYFYFLLLFHVYSLYDYHDK